MAIRSHARLRALFVRLVFGALLLTACSSSGTVEAVDDTLGVTTTTAPSALPRTAETAASKELATASPGLPSGESETTSTTANNAGATTTPSPSGAESTPVSTTTTASTVTGGATSTTMSTVAPTQSTTTTTRPPTTTSTTGAPTSTTAAISKPSRIDLPTAVDATEGIATDTSTGRIFVGDLNNGNVWAGSLDGQPFTLFANASQAGRSNALGLATDESRRRLFIVSNAQGRVDIVNLDNGGHIASVPLPGAVGLNDATVAPDGTVYVTDMGHPQVFRIGAGATTGELWVDYSGAGAVATAGRSLHGNGIVADTSTVLVAYMETGELIRFERSNGDAVRVQHNGGGITGRDGLVRCGNTLLGVDNTSFAGGQDTIWVSRLAADRRTSNATGTLTANNSSVPSTAALLGDQLIVVNAQFGAVRQTPFWLSVVDAPC